jgi:hypothetical protein
VTRAAFTALENPKDSLWVLTSPRILYHLEVEAFAPNAPRAMLCQQLTGGPGQSCHYYVSWTSKG